MDEISPKKVELLLKEVRKSADSTSSFYATKLNKSIEEVKQLLARGDEDFDREMSAEEAKDIGLITDIIEQNAEIFPTASASDR